MSFRVCSLIVLYVVASHITLIDAAPFTHFFARDAGDSSTTGFRLQNGIQAQKLNAQFATLTASDSCTAGSIACVTGAFAQCVGEKWTLTQCSNGLSCFALPLVNSNGTSIACDTEQDALARISASGASGGLTGAGNGSNGAASVSGTTSTPTSNPNNSGGSSGSTPTSVAGSPTSVAGSATPSSSSNVNSTPGGQTAGDDSGDDCNDDSHESSSDGNSTATGASDEGGDDCDGDDPNGDSGVGRNATNSKGTSTDTSGTFSDNDCDGNDTMGDSGVGGNSTNSNDTSTDTSGINNITSSSAPNGSSQLYRRQFPTDTGAATFAVPTQTAQTPSFSSDQTGAPLSNLPSFTPTPSNPTASTVTFTLFSTVTMTVSGCQGNPTNFPSLSSGTPGFPSAPPNTTPTVPFTFSTPASSTPTASGIIPPSNTFTTPTSSSPSSGATLGGGGISFSSQGGNNVDLEPTPTTTGPSSTLNLSELLTATV